MQTNIAQCLSQAMIYWEGCFRNGIWCTVVSGVDRGDGNPNELASNWIIAVRASVGLVRSVENQKYGLISIIVGRCQHCPVLQFAIHRGGLAVLWPPMQLALTWALQQCTIRLLHHVPATYFLVPAHPGCPR